MLLTLMEWEEILQTCSKIYGCHMIGLIEHLPDVCLNVLERCQIPSDDDPKSEQYHIKYNFKYLDTPKECLEIIKKISDGQEVFPLMALYVMVKNNRVECLSHPVCVTFLKVKWTHYGMWIYSAYLIIYIMFLISLTTFVVHNNSLMRSQYFANIGNGLEWALYLTCSIFVLPFLLQKSFHWQWEAGALAIFFAWFNCLVFLHRFDFFGIYVVMFLEILRTLFQVILVFSILIIAFGLSFYMLLFKEESKAFSTPTLSLLRTFTMMLELDYMGSFNDQYTDTRDDTLHFGTLTLAFLTGFVLLMPILLMNLLIGLAVGDIESVQSNARLKRLAMQVELHIQIEKKMPSFILEKVTVTEYYHFPNRGQKNIFSMISFINAENSGNLETDIQQSYVFGELNKQKAKLREISTLVEKNNELLQKIVQKMDIHTEHEAWDEGAGPHSDESSDDSDGKHKEGRKAKSSKVKLYLKSSKTSII